MPGNYANSRGISTPQSRFTPHFVATHLGSGCAAGAGPPRAGGGRRRAVGHLQHPRPRARGRAGVCGGAGHPRGQGVRCPGPRQAARHRKWGLQHRGGECGGLAHAAGR
eukprot:9467202-Pyramimonas_sp.AAC.1